MGYAEQLYRLELCNNNIGNLEPARIAKLASKIADCSNLKILDLSNNNLHLLEQESWVVLAENLAKSGSLATIILHDNQLGSLDHKLLSAILNNLAKINLKNLDLAWNELGNNHALGVFIDKIVSYTTLNKLDLSYNNLVEDFFQFNRLFHNLQQIKALNLSNNKLGLIAGIFNPDVGISHKLEILDVSNNELGNSEQIFIFMMQQASTAKELNLSNNQLYLLANKLRLSNCKHLEVLKLADNDFSKFNQQNIIDLIASFSRFDNLRELDLDKTNLFDSLINNNHLISVSLADNKLGLTTITAKLSELLKQNKLICLDLSDNLLNCLREVDWQHLLIGLAASYNLKILNISSNALETLSTERIITLCQALKNCNHLEKLDVGDQNFSVTDVDKLQILFTALSELPNLKK